MDLETFLRKGPEGTLMEIVVQPRASRNELAGMHQGSLKIRLTSPPVEGEANKECIRFLAKLLGTARSNLEIVQGHKSRHKTILVRDASPEAVEEALKAHLPA
ncbi:MAG: DUF167 domain-containing protein [Syntrophobacteraceae bacterium]|nr:DUF167 domain-containing protein [Desulfobacteraceae bacterium]